MIDRIKDYFSFSKKEQRGLIILLGLMLLSLAANILLPAVIPEKEFDIAPFREEVEKFLASAEKPDSTINKRLQKYPDQAGEKDSPVLAPFLASPYNFDPNELTEKQWTDMGMKAQVIHNIIRYREKGGKFRDSEGLRRIYGMDETAFKIIEPYLKFPENDKKPAIIYKDTNRNNEIYNRYTIDIKPDTAIIELNSADSAALLSLKGIGPYFAGKIIRYRDRLGGFIKEEQLLEIKGMDSARFDQLKDRIRIEPSTVRRIDLNKATFKEMLRHPYFEYNLVKAIFNYKDDIKTYDSVGQLRNIPVMYEELYLKILPYMEVK